MADNLSRQQRSFCMSQVRTRYTDLEQLIAKELRHRGLSFRRHDASLPGKPDVVFRQAKLAVFVDGDFWHGYRFPCWRHKVSPFWQRKIAQNRLRDQRNFQKLRRMGWKPIRIWQTQIKANLESCVSR